MQKAEFEQGLNGAALVGPFPAIDETRLKIYNLFFRPIVMGLPWYLDPPAAYRIEGAREPIRFIYPPEELKPGPDFIKQVKDFKQAQPQNRDTESHAYLKTAQSREKQEESGRDIERELRGLKEAVSAESPNRGRLWNLTLHLAHAIETRAAETARMLAQIRTRPSPLTVLQEGEEAPGFFIDLPPREPEFSFNEQQMEQVCAAWCGLFESYLGAFPFLILNRKEVGEFLGGIGEGEQAVEATLTFALPDPAHYALQAFLELGNAYVKPQYLEAFHKALNALRDRPKEAQAELGRVGDEIEKAWPEELKKQNLRMKIRTLRPITNPAHLRNRPWLKAFFNKVLIYMDSEV